MSEASKLEAEFPTETKKYFAIPTFDSTGIRPGDKTPVTYLCGNSLGLMPLGARELCLDELNAWAGEGVIGHHKRFDGREPWIVNDIKVSERLAELIFGCKKDEVVLAGTLTTNLNALFQAFYKPTAKRFKIMCEAKSFPSDLYSFQSQIEMHGLKIEDALITIPPRENELTIRTEDILKAIEEHGDELAIVCFSGVQFYTGQYFDIPAITKATKAVGAISGWDLAHASGNVVLNLHDWDVDFAVFCSYKYLNCGAGNTGGFFIHENMSAKHQNDPRPSGWWGVDLKTRFDMEFKFVPAEGVLGYRQSNCGLFGPACMDASLNVFEAVNGVKGLEKRQKALTAFLMRSLKASKHYGKKFRVMTESLPESETGAQVSIYFLIPMGDIPDQFEANGIIGDARKPSVMRLCTAPLYNTFFDVEKVVNVLNSILDNIN